MWYVPFFVTDRCDFYSLYVLLAFQLKYSLFVPSAHMYDIFARLNNFCNLHKVVLHKRGRENIFLPPSALAVQTRATRMLGESCNTELRTFPTLGLRLSKGPLKRDLALTFYLKYDTLQYTFPNTFFEISINGSHCNNFQVTILPN